MHQKKKKKLLPGRVSSEIPEMKLIFSANGIQFSVAVISQDNNVRI